MTGTPCHHNQAVHTARYTGAARHRAALEAALRKGTR
jgi:hypothetical protein